MRSNCIQYGIKPPEQFNRYKNPEVTFIWCIKREREREAWSYRSNWRRNSAYWAFWRGPILKPLSFGLWWCFSCMPFCLIQWYSQYGSWNMTRRRSANLLRRAFVLWSAYFIQWFIRASFGSVMNSRGLLTRWSNELIQVSFAQIYFDWS